MADNLRKYTTQEVLNKVFTDSSGNAIGINSSTTKETLNAVFSTSDNSLNVALSGGTISGDVTISGDLTVNGSATNSYDEIVNGDLHVKSDSGNSTSAFLVEKNDGTDVFVVDTTNSNATFGGNINIGDDKALTLGAGSDSQIFNTGSHLFIRNNTSDQDIIFQVNDGGSTQTEVMRIDASSSSATFSGDVTVSKSSDGADSSLTINNSASHGSTDETASLKFQQAGYTGGKIVSNRAFNYSSAGNRDSTLQFYTSQDATDTLAMTIDSSQNATFSGDVFISNSTPILRLDDSDVSTNVSLDGSGGIVKLASHTGQTIRFLIGSTEVSRFDSSGNLGIGSDSPIDGGGSKTVLTISDSTQSLLVFEDTGFESSGDGLGMFAYNDGTLTYRTASRSGTDFTGSTNRLVIDANSRISLSNNDSGTSNTLFGYQAGNAIADSDSTGNVLIGHRAGRIANNSAFDNNVAVGFEAMQGVGGRNLQGAVAIGSGALRQCDSGAPDGTVAIGFESLYNLSSGTGNTAIGYQALQGHTTGARNTVLGYQAMDGTGGATVLDSNDNTFMGYHAGGGTWTTAVCQYNVGIGNYALDGAMNGAEYNVGVGYDALTALTSGDSNIAVGAFALADNTTARFNTAIGGATLQRNIDGEHNTALGYVAGKFSAAGASNVTSPDQCTIIGSLAEFSSATPTNQIVIGYGADGLADNSVTLGNTDITDVYMAQDSGATIHAGGIRIGSPTTTSFATNIKASSDVLSLEADGTGGPQLRMTDTSSTSNDDVFGLIDFSAKDAGDNQLVMNRILNKITDTNTSSTDSELSIYAMSNDTLTETVRIGSGILYLPQGQLQFPDTQNPSSDAHTLDDYEEGTYTATITPSTSGTIPVDSSADKLSYVKIGSKVTVNGAINTGTVSSPVGFFTINLPFAVEDKDELSGRFSGSVTIYGGSGLNVSDYVVIGIEGESGFRVYAGDATTIVSDSANSIVTGTSIALSVTYFTS